MIDAVSKVSFRGDAGADLINAPGKYSVPAQVTEMPADSFETTGEKKSKKGLKAFLATAAIALLAFAGLGYAVKSGKLTKVDEIVKDANFYTRAVYHIRNAAAKVGGWAESCYYSIAGLFGRKTEFTRAASK